MKQRLIDANVLKESVNGVSTHWLNDWSTLGVLAMIDKQPTVDAVPVRCKDCKHHEVFKNGVNGWCNGHGCPTDVTYFCADGERRTDETEGS